MFGSLKSFSNRSHSKQLCPECDQEIEPRDISMKEGMALCSGCGELTRLSELNLTGRSSEEVLGTPPAGCTAQIVSRGVTLQASLASAGGFLGMAAISLFWNGIVSVFTVVAAAGLYSNLVGPIPEWFPAPGVEDGEVLMNNKPMGIGGTLFLCLFLTPFWLIGSGMILGMVTSLCGRVEVQIEGAHSFVATGAGPFVWKKRFQADQVDSVVLASPKWKSSDDDQASQLIELQGAKSIRFGSQLPEERLEWLRVALKEVLLKPREDWRDALLVGRGTRGFNG